jgi:hypothetical protein
MWGVMGPKHRHSADLGVVPAASTGIHGWLCS